MSTPGVVFLLGPTASGKTGLAVELAAALNAEIVSVDSAMVYRGMDIGTAKPDAVTRARAPHALIDIRDPAEPYSAAEFRRDARAEIERIHAAGRLALLTGGTSLYFRALEHGLSALPPRDEGVRARLSAEAATRGWAVLHARLAEIDPQRATAIHPNDAQRIQRALEIHALTGAPPSTLHTRDRAPECPWPICKLVVAPGRRDSLHARITARFDAMLAAGLVDEVEMLFARPDLNESMPSVRAVGYRQLWQVMAGHLSLNDGVQRAVYASRQLAKRQLTWLRSLQSPRWFDSDDPNLAEQAQTYVSQWVGRL